MASEDMASNETNDSSSLSSTTDTSTPTSTNAATTPVQAWRNDGRCGVGYDNAPCPPGVCCSAYGYCGVGSAWCDPLFGCQAQCSGITAGASIGVGVPLPPKQRFQIHNQTEENLVVESEADKQKEEGNKMKKSQDQKKKKEEQREKKKAEQARKKADKAKKKAEVIDKRKKNGGVSATGTMTSSMLATMFFWG